MQSLRVLTVSHRVLGVLLALSCGLGLLAVWWFWVAAGRATAVAGIALFLVSLAGGVAAWLIFRRLRLGLLLAAIFFGLQIVGFDIETFSWSLQAGLTMEFAIPLAGVSLIINVVALLLAAWSAILYRRAGL